jgi:hypothetical protein
MDLDFAPTFRPLKQDSAISCVLSNSINSQLALGYILDGRMQGGEFLVLKIGTRTLFHRKIMPKLLQSSCKFKDCKWLIEKDKSWKPKELSLVMTWLRHWIVQSGRHHTSSTPVMWAEKYFPVFKSFLILSYVSCRKLQHCLRKKWL